jgi:hypothetical protein
MYPVNFRTTSFEGIQIAVEERTRPATRQLHRFFTEIRQYIVILCLTG